MLRSIVSNILLLTVLVAPCAADQSNKTSDVSSPTTDKVIDSEPTSSAASNGQTTAVAPSLEELEKQSAKLSTLEQCIFDKTYTTDSVEHRLDRLEHFVFGSPQNGSLTKRLNRLAIDIPTAFDDTASDQKDASNTTSKDTPVDAKSTAPIADSTGDYPTVTALEKVILGHTNDNMPLPTRLDKLEEKAFGNVSLSNDLALRVDKLKQFERSQNPNDDYLSTDAPIFSAKRPMQVLPLSSQLDQMEKVVFAKTYSRDGVVSRLDRLEKTVYPGRPLNTFESIPTRVEKLEKALGVTVPADTSRVASTKSTNSTPIFTDRSSGVGSNEVSGPHHSFLHKLGSVLGGIGEAGLMTLGSGMYYGGYGYGYPYGYGGMYGGMYPGMYGGMYPGMYGGMYPGMYGGGIGYPYGYSRTIMW